MCLFLTIHIFAMYCHVGHILEFDLFLLYIFTLFIRSQVGLQLHNHFSSLWIRSYFITPYSWMQCWTEWPYFSIGTYVLLFKMILFFLIKDQEQVFSLDIKGSPLPLRIWMEKIGQRGSQRCWKQRNVAGSESWGNMDHSSEMALHDTWRSYLPFHNL